MTTRLYFAYGSNLNQGDLQDWCHRGGCACPKLAARGTALLPDHELAFAYNSTSRKGGVLDIRQRVGHVVEGVVFEVDEDGWGVLDHKEGAPRYYEPIHTVVLDGYGNEIPVTTYRVTAPYRRDFVPPHPDYVQVVQAGLAGHGLTDDALLAASQNRPARPLVDAVFVYGTLMRGEPRFPALRRFEPRCILMARAYGRLVSLGSFPGLVDADKTDRLVEGEFVRLSRLEPALEVLDRIEGFRGFGKADSLYRRTMITVDVGESRIRRAWTYRFAGEAAAAPTIESGDWRSHRGVKANFLRDLVAAHAKGREPDVAAVLATGLPFSFDPDPVPVAQSLLPLDRALARGEVSERMLAQAGGNWAACLET